MDPEIRQFFDELTRDTPHEKSKTLIEDEEEKEAVETTAPIMFSHAEPQLAKASNFSVKTHSSESHDDKEMDTYDNTEGQLTIDAFHTKDEIIIESTIAAISPEDLDINISKDSVFIRGTRERERKVEDKAFLYQECYWGSFSRTIILPEEVDPDGAQASLKNGVLTIKLPKAHKVKSTKKLKVKLH